MSNVMLRQCILNKVTYKKIEGRECHTGENVRVVGESLAIVEDMAQRKEQSAEDKVIMKSY